MTPDEGKFESRLHDLGTRAVDPSLASTHLGAMAGVAPGRAGVGVKLRVAAAFFAGLLIGGTGLAAANALPASMQSVAHTTLSKVGVNVPPGHDRVTDGCGTDTSGQPFKNHGQYVKAHKGDPAAAQSDCGKPKVSVHDTSSTDTGDSQSKCAGQGPTTPPAAANAKGKATGKANAGSKCDKADDSTAEPSDTTDTPDPSKSSPKSDNAGSGSTDPGSVNGTASPKADEKAGQHTDTAVPPAPADGSDAASSGAQP
jgi:hypothetical protein